MKKDSRISIILFLILIFCSRLPFLNNGYGAEEDSWGLVRAARTIMQTNSYEASRLPGHPFQEYVYSTIAQEGPVFYNLFTLFLSTAGILFFILILKKINAKEPLMGGVSLAFVPVIYINCVNNMDYLWALAFILISFYLLLSKKYFLSGLFLAFAVGCRITSVIILPLFLFFTWKTGVQKMNSCIRLLLSAILFSILLFLPVYLKYGISFFSATDYFPYPSLTKVIYKGTIGVFGSIGIIAVCIFIIQLFMNRKSNHQSGTVIQDKKFLVQISLAIIILFSIGYIIKPEKSAYLVPVIPFIILIAAMTLQRKQMTLFTLLIVASSFVAGINLEDPLRGSNSSSLSVKKNISGQQISFDLIQGPVIADYYKRKNKMEFVSEIVNKISELHEKTVIIAGWWLNEILVEISGAKNPDVELEYYIDEKTLEEYRQNGYSVFFLPEQDRWNDLRYHESFTIKYASPWLVGESSK